MFDVKYTLLTILVIILIVLSLVVYFTLSERESFQTNTEEVVIDLENIPEDKTISLPLDSQDVPIIFSGDKQYALYFNDPNNNLNNKWLY